MTLDISFEMEVIKEAICSEMAIIRAALAAPHVLYKPTLKPDGTEWCALLGDDLMVGVAGFGDTPEAAMKAFDEAWRNEGTPAARLAEERVKEKEKYDEH